MNRDLSILNSAAAVERLGGDHELYIEICEIFLKDISHQVEVLSDRIEAGELELITRTFHSISGSAGNIGAVKIAAEARELELSSSRGEEVTKNIDSFKSLAAETIEAVKNYLKPI